VLIAGHGRVMAAKRLGLASVPALRLGHLSPAQARALRLADNQIALNSGWDEALLTAEIARIRDEAVVDLDVLGFSAEPLDQLLAQVGQAAAAGVVMGDEDAPAPEPPARPVSRPGDLWQLGPHLLLCGDATAASDVARLLGGMSAAANKMLLAAYQPARPTYREIFLRRDFRDFKPHRHLRVGDFPTFLPLAENGEIQAGTMSESQEIVLLQTFARRIRVTRPMLVNDDLGAFTDFAAAIGRRVADFENATAYALLNSANGDGPTLATGNAAVFATAAARANKASAGTALDLANLALGRAAVMRQKTLDGLPIAIGSAMRLLVGPNQELPARQLTVAVSATQTSNANVYAGFIQPLVEPLIPANRW
jgi:hypothetical protein